MSFLPPGQTPFSVSPFSALLPSSWAVSPPRKRVWLTVPNLVCNAHLLVTLQLPSACSVPPVCVFAAFFVSVDAIFPSVCCLDVPPTLDYKIPPETPNNRVLNLNGKPCVGVKEAFPDWLPGGRGTV